MSEAGGPHENMIDGLTGVVCAGTEPARWGAVAADLLHNTAARREMALAARQCALTRRWEVSLTSLYDVYRDVMERASDGAHPVHHAA